MRIFRDLVMLLTAALAISCASADDRAVTTSLELAGDILPAHDPVLIREGGTYYSFSTGLGDRLPLMARASDDLKTWRPLPSPLATVPDWAKAVVPGSKGFWAPDIAKVNGRYRLYYSISTFGSRSSAIGLATSASLDPHSPDYRWQDEGLVVSSSDVDEFNAIDANFFADDDGRHWLSFGSFWGGLKLVELDTVTGKPLPDAPFIAIARRGGDANYAVEAPFIVARDDHYYLIVSFDHCCRGAKSDYKLAVGRADAITGPYLDRSGVPMMQGGGTILVEAAPDDRFQGPGHAGYLRDSDGTEYLIHHAYDRENRGRPALRLEKLRWDADGWPYIVTGDKAHD